MNFQYYFGKQLYTKIKNLFFDHFYIGCIESVL